MAQHSTFSHVEAFAGDPILALTEMFVQDTKPNKVNLGIGIYYDNNSKIPVLDGVKQAEKEMLERSAAKSYLPIEGLSTYRSAIQNILFGATSQAVTNKRIATIQTIGGSGALKVGADFLKRYFPEMQVWISDPSWDNHRAIFEGAGFTVNTYPYYDAKTGGLNFDGMLATLDQLPKNSLVLLHACCHNPTGVDLNMAQWQSVLNIVKKRELVAFMDIAYMGFGDGTVEDCAPIRLFTEAGVSFFVANSFSKNFSVYGERCGGLSVVCSDSDEASRVLGQLKFTIRRNYSSPPMHGAHIVATVLNDAALNAAWQNDLAQMRERIKAMRVKLREILEAKVAGRSFEYMTTQRGMFSYTGLSPEQVDRLKNEFGIYLVRSGRMCVAALNEQNITYVANSIAAVLS